MLNTKATCHYHVLAFFYQCNVTVFVCNGKISPYIAVVRNHTRARLVLTDDCGARRLMCRGPRADPQTRPAVRLSHLPRALYRVGERVFLDSTGSGLRHRAVLRHAVRTAGEVCGIRRGALGRAMVRRRGKTSETNAWEGLTACGSESGLL